MKKILIAVLLMLTSCSSDEEDVYLYIKIEDSEMNLELVDLLRANDVDVRSGKEGKIWYKESDYNIVNLIKEELIARYYKDESITFDDEKYIRSLVEKLESKNIPYNVVTKRGERHISWSKENKKSVFLEIEEVRGEIKRDKQVARME